MRLERVKKGYIRVRSGTVKEGDIVYSLNYHRWYGSGWREWDVQLSGFPGNFIGQKVNAFYGVARKIK